MKRGKSSVKGFKNFVKQHLVGRTLASYRTWIGSTCYVHVCCCKDQPRFNVSESSSLGTVMGNAYGRLTIGGLLTAGLVRTNELRRPSRSQRSNHGKQYRPSHVLG